MKGSWFDLSEDEKEERLRLAAAPHMEATPIKKEAKRLLIEYLGAKHEINGVKMYANRLWGGDVGLTLEYVYRQHKGINEPINGQWGCMRQDCKEWAGLNRVDPCATMNGKKLYGYQTKRTWSELSLLFPDFDRRIHLINALITQPEIC